MLKMQTNLSFHFILCECISFKPLTKMSDAIGENQTADDSMNIIIAQEDENSNIEENRSMAPNIGSTQVIQSDIGSDGMR